MLVFADDFTQNRSGPEGAYTRGRPEEFTPQAASGTRIKTAAWSRISRYRVRQLR